MLLAEHRQSILYNLTHRIDEFEPLCFGFRDAGRHTLLDYCGQPVSSTHREIIVAKNPAEDPILNEVIDKARAATATMAEAEKIDWLSEYVAGLLKVGDPRANWALLNEIAGEGGAAGVEISLGQMISAGTGVCRHRSLLFKVLADQLGIPAALVRGTYVPRGQAFPVQHEVDRGDDLPPEPVEGSGATVSEDATRSLVYVAPQRAGHAWNEVALKSGERILVDAMNNLIADFLDPRIASYSDVRDRSLYPQAGSDRTDFTLPPDWLDKAKDLAIVRAVPWVSVSSRSGGRSAYAFLDAIGEAATDGLHDALKALDIPSDRYATSLGGNGAKREVLRVRGTAFLLLQRTAAKLDCSVPARATEES